MHIKFNVFYSCTLFFVFFLPAFPALSEPERQAIFSQKNYTAAINYIREFAEYHREENDIPGLSYALIDGDKIVWQGGLGVSHKHSKKKADELTLYRSGTLSMLMTATLIIQLEQEGKLKLNDPISKYYPKFGLASTDQKSIPTIKQLLTHHAGLPLSYFNGMWTDSPESLQQITDRIVSMPTSFERDKVFAYSNLGYNLLGGIVEKITKKSFSDVANNKLFSPLKMEFSSFNWSKVNKNNLAAGYKNGDLKRFLKTRDIPALGLVSNVNDLAKFTQATMGLLPSAERILKYSAWENMAKIHNGHVKLDLNKGIGLGWRIGGMDTKHDVTVVWKQGSTLLHRSRIAMVPELGLGVVIMANSNKSFRTLDTISSEALGVLLEIKLGKQLDKQEKPSLPPGNFSDFKPLYSSYAGLLKTEKEGDNILLSAMGWRLVLKPEANGWYRLEYDLLGFIPLKLDWFAKVRVAAVEIDGINVAIIRQKGVNYLFASALEPSMPSKKWHSRIGTYEPKTKDSLLEHFEVDDGELKLYEGILVFEYELPALLPLTFRIPLIPLSDDEALIPGLGTGLNERVSVGQDASGEYLLYSGYKIVAKKSAFFGF